MDKQSETIIRIKEDINLVSFFNIKGKDLKVDRINKVQMSTGTLDFYVVSDNGQEYEINSEYVTINE